MIDKFSNTLHQRHLSTTLSSFVVRIFPIALSAGCIINNSSDLSEFEIGERTSL